MLAATVLSLAILFVGLPMLVFGVHDALVLTEKWLQAVLTACRPGNPYIAFGVSPGWLARALFSPELTGGKFNVAALSDSSIGDIVRLFLAFWGLVLAGYFVTSLSLDRSMRRGLGRRDYLLDFSVLLLAPLPCTSAPQPHHLVLLYLPALLLLRIAFDPAIAPNVRKPAGLTVALGFCFTEFGPRYPLRGIGVTMTLLAYAAGIWMVRSQSASAPEGGAPPVPGGHDARPTDTGR